LQPEELQLVIARMEEAGYGDAAIDGIVGGNYLRIAREVWR